MNPARHRAWLLPLALGCSFLALAEEQPTPASITANADSGLVGGIDKKTGKLRTLSDAEIRSLSERANAMPSKARAASVNPAWARIPRTSEEAAKTQLVRVDGSSSMDLPLSAMNALSVERTKSGQLQMLEDGAPLSGNNVEAVK